MKVAILHDDHTFLDMVVQAMDYFGLTDWNAEMNNSRTALGQCHFDDMRLEFSRLILPKVNHITRFDTILHEIAHAIAGKDAAHGPEWIAVAYEIGCTARPTVETHSYSVKETNYSWIGVCPSGHRIGRTFKPKNFYHSCNRCTDRYSPAHIFRWYKDGNLFFDPRLTPYRLAV